MCRTDPPEEGVLEVPAETRWNRFQLEMEQETTESESEEDTSSMNGAVPCGSGYCSDGKWIFPREEIRKSYVESQ